MSRGQQQDGVSSEDRQPELSASRSPTCCLPPQGLMARALELAARGRGFVEPNPMVGAVVVREGRVVGEGHHEQFGAPHAEIQALNAAGEWARGATVYVSLEPCAHHGKTPPCTDALIRAGVAKVVAAMPDPFPAVAGRGFAALRQAGIEVVSGILEAEAHRLNAAYLHLLATGRPYVLAKWAMTLDGRIAACGGDSRWVSGAASRRRVHEIRGRMDAILVGIGTALADDPLLTARPPGPRTPLRVILDSAARLPAASQLVLTARESPVLVAVAESAPRAEVARLRGSGCEVMMFPLDPQGRGVSIEPVLRELGARRLTNLLVEGGGEVLGSLFDAGRINAVEVFLASKLIGGRSASGPLGGEGLTQMAEAATLDHLEIERLENDLVIRGTLCPAGGAKDGTPGASAREQVGRAGPHGQTI